MNNLCWCSHPKTSHDKEPFTKGYNVAYNGTGGGVMYQKVGCKHCVCVEYVDREEETNTELGYICKGYKKCGNCDSCNQ